MRRQPSRKMSICEPVVKESEVQGGTKMNAINVAILSVAFGINFFGGGLLKLVTCRNECLYEFCGAHSRYSLLAYFIVGNIGSIGMAIVNIVNSFSNFLVPSVIKTFGSAERTIFWCSFSYM